MTEEAFVGAESFEMDGIAYSFHVRDIARVRHSLIKASRAKGCDSHTAQVLRAQADIIAGGLHFDDVEDVPNFMADVAHFHEHFGLEYLGKPRILPPELHSFRDKFAREEIDEYNEEYSKLTDALERQDDRDITNSLELQLDALCDAMYVILGTAYLQFGTKAFYEAWKRVQLANMRKVRAEASGDDRSKRDAKFDVVKPDGWVAPDHRDLVRNHAHKIYRKGDEDANPNYKGDAIGIAETTFAGYDKNGEPILIDTSHR